MEFYFVNFEVIEEAFLSAESKEQIQTVFLAIATSSLDSEIRCLDSSNLPPTLRNLPKTLNISNDKAITVKYCLLTLISWLFLCTTSWRSILAHQWWTRTSSLPGFLLTSKSNSRLLSSKSWGKSLLKPKNIFRRNSAASPNSETSTGDSMWKLPANSKREWNNLYYMWN